MLQLSDYDDDYDYDYDSDSDAYANPCSDSRIIATLDRDDTDSYGPETITICKQESVEGIYRFYVHHYEGSQSISNSQATVRVETLYGISQTFTPPTTGASGTDDVWHVFDMDSDGVIYPVNRFEGKASEDDRSVFKSIAKQR